MANLTAHPTRMKTKTLVLTLMALVSSHLVTQVSAAEIAAGINLDGWVDTVATGTTNNNDEKLAGTNSTASPSTTDFASSALLRVGWQPTEKVAAVMSFRTPDDQGALEINEAYGTVAPSDQWLIGAGKSYGPFGYFAAEPTGLYTVTNALVANLYSVSPTGVWATCTPNEHVNVTLIVADGLATDAFPGGKASADTNDVSPGLDVVWTPSSQLAMDFEAYADPHAGGVDADNNPGHIYTFGFNAQYTTDGLRIGVEALERITQYAGTVSTTGGDNADHHEFSWAAVVTGKLPESTPWPMSLSAQVSQLINDQASGSASGNTLTKAQLALLTNPLTSTNFAANIEVFYLQDGHGNPITDGALDTYGVALEGLFVLK